MANHDLRSVLPSSVIVVFPRADSGVVGSAVYAVTVTLPSLAIPEYVGFTGHAGSHVIRSTAIALFTGGGSPTNDTELTSLAQAIARDFYRYRAARVDMRLIGVPSWELSGLDDHLEITYQLDDLSTRIQRPAWNEAVEELPISGSGGSVINVNVFNDPVVFNDFVTFNESITLSQYFTFPRTSVTLNTTQNNYNLTDTTVVLKVNATADFDLTGIDNGVGGRFLWIENLIGSTGTVTLKHLSASSSAENRIVTPDIGDYPIPPGSKIALDYNDTDNFWYIVGLPRFPKYVQTTWNTNQNNYPIPPGVGLIKANVTGNMDLTGIAAPSPEVPYLLTIENRPSSTNNLSIPHLSGSSSAGNRIQTDTGSTVILAPGQSVQLQYDPLDDVWIMIGRTNGSGAGTVTSVALTAPDLMAVTGSPITSSGTFGVDWTGLTSGDVPYATGSTTMSKLAIGSTDQFLTVVAGAPAWTTQFGLGGSGERWVKYTRSYTDFSFAGTSNSITLQNLGARGVCRAVVIKHSTPFTGGSITAYTISLIMFDGTTEFSLTSLDVFQSTGDLVFAPLSSVPDDRMISNFAGGVIKAIAASTGDNLNNATAGSVDIWLLLSTLP